MSTFPMWWGLSKCVVMGWLNGFCQDIFSVTHQPGIFGIISLKFTSINLTVHEFKINVNFKL